ncbi:MAG: 3-oxoacyl-[acyl-carrier-protein] reductase [Planctomycetota bacterium]|nr:3-oxoacyl-[acyl-carrier-protein] reductase [Planctomycetota bacterium]
MGRFDGKKVLVTGGSRGIGRTLCLEFAREGAKVATVARSGDALQETAHLVEEAGGKCLAIPVDVTQSASVNEAVAQILEQLGGLDVLVNNAGVTRDGPLIRMSDESWDEVMDTNMKGTFYFTRAAARPMLKKKTGCIVNLTSVVGIMGNPGQANYSASKAAIIGFTKACAKEFSRRGVRVNAVAPGFVDTAMTEALGDQVKESILSRVPLGRFGSAEEVAEAVLFLAGDEASYMTGVVLQVNGGLHM